MSLLGDPPSEDPDQMDEKRLRTLTMKGQEAFQENTEKLRKELEQEWNSIQTVVMKFDECKSDINAIQLLERTFTSSVERFNKKYEIFHRYLVRENTEDSLKEVKDLESYLDRCQPIMRNMKESFSNCLLEHLETLSSSHACSSTTKRRFKAELSETKLKFKQQEAELLKQKAYLKEQLEKTAAETEYKKAVLDISLDLIKTEKENAEAQVEARVHEEDELDRRSIIDKKELTKNYIKNLNMTDINDHCSVTSEQQNNQNSTKVKNPDNIQQLNPEAQVFTPMSNTSTTLNELSNFLIRKDLQLNRFSAFNDKPEFFVAWRTSFKSIVSELSLKPHEEIDLLVKYLGPESKRFAESIKAANVHNPSKGLHDLWYRLENKYGKPEVIENILKKKIANFPRIQRDYTVMYDLLDLLCEIQSLKEQRQFCNLLAYFDSSSGVTPILNKLPYGIQDKWAFHASKYKRQYNVPFPPFDIFVSFIRDICETKNDPSFSFENNVPSKDGKSKHQVFSRKQDVEIESKSFRCPLHKADHSLNSCRSFKAKPIEERKALLRDYKICFKCCNSKEHIAKNCKADLKCSHCGKKHTSAMHIDGYQTSHKSPDGGEQSVGVTSKCTALCNEKFIGKSCSKTVLVDVYPKGHPEKTKRVYAIIDDQSNRSLGTNSLFNSLGCQSDYTQYTLSSCSGRITSSGRTMHDLCVKSVKNSTEVYISTVLECDDLPNETSEIPTPDVAKAYEHLSDIAYEIPKFESNCNIELLIGRDIPEAHHVLEQVTGQKGTPFAQHLPLGWVIIGEICLGLVHTPEVTVNKINVMSDGRSTRLVPCKYNFTVKESPFFSKGDSLFIKTSNDDKIGLSVEDRQFLELMDKNMTRDSDGFWTAPLPFKRELQPLAIPNNRAQAWHRAQILDSSLKKNSVKKQHFVSFMDKVLKSGAAKVAEIKPKGSCFYLPLFGVYHSKKPNQLRGVFDSSAVYQGISLNSLLMSGPDLVNSLVGILLRFRKDAVAITGDIEQMFYRFRVCEGHQNYLRFFWYKNNDPDENLIEYQMCVHVFGNCASPAIATYGLNKAVEKAEDDVKEFVKSDFYVDDALTSKPNAFQAIDLMKRTQSALYKGGKLRLHKIASNSSDVMRAFPDEDLGKDLKSLDFDSEDLPMQRSLGIYWNLRNDCFLFKTTLDKKPFTRRGLLSVVNSIFDPLGFISPLTVTGKILLREATPHGVDWDEPLSAKHQVKWSEWKQSLEQSEDITIPRMFTNISFSEAEKTAIYIFSDASEKAVAAVSYIRLWNNCGNSDVGFLISKAKLAPQSGHTVPRLELCAAVLATELAATISTQLDIPLDSITYFTDSKVVLGYICNQTRRFFTYVSNRVEKILKVSTPSQWRYIPSARNPADIATREVKDPCALNNGFWFSGPKFLRKEDPKQHGIEQFPLINPEEDKEIKGVVPVSALKISVETSSGLGCERFERFSSWTSLTNAILCLKLFLRKKSSEPKVQNDTSIKDRENTEIFVLREVQRQCYPTELNCLRENRHLPNTSSLVKLSPFIDNQGLLRVGGRLSMIRESVLSKDIHPIILPKKNHVSLLLVRHYHETVKHQGRILTEGAIRNAGFWIIGVKQIIASLIHKCVICRRSRRDTEHQKMADLPEDRITPGPAFTSVGIDTFGPWEVSTRKTRGGSAKSKRWAILFTCLTSRAVHIELVEEMSSSSFINAFRRFLSIRGPVKLIRSDRGTNFIGATDDLDIQAIKVEDGPLNHFLDSNKIQWIFNAPHSSHMGGVWERVIGMTRRILDSILYQTRHRPLTHETLSTFMAEVSAILNDRPLSPISTDPCEPLILKPSMLLTGKSDSLPPIANGLTEKDAYRAMWKRVQFMAEEFWKLWRRDYLHLLNSRKKWHAENTNLKIGDIVLLKDSSEHRNNWPMGMVNDVFCSKDNLVRKIEVRVIKDGKYVLYLRPVNEVVLLLN